MSIKIHFKDKASRKSQRQFKVDVKEIRLYRKGIAEIDLSSLESCTQLELLELHGNSLKSIDLSPISSCTTLQRLRLHENELNSIDLSPLSNCLDFRELYLSYNNLTSIDLSPLISCKKLVTLGLSNNKLQSIDLEPLSSCANLETLYLGSNQLQTIDLSPLSTCTDLEELSLRYNQLQSIDFSPLSKCKSIERLELSDEEDVTNPFQVLDVTALSGITWEELVLPEELTLISWLNKQGAEYGRPTLVSNWSFLHEIVENHDEDYRLQHDILHAIGLADYGFIDRSLWDHLKSISPETSIDKVREELIPVLVSEILKAVDDERSTVGVNLESLIPKHPEMASKMKRIVELRHAEIKSLQLKTVKRKVEGYNWEAEFVDLRNLWLTAYGHAVLSKLDVRLDTDSSQILDTIKQSFNELGHKLKIGRQSKLKVKMSDELRESITWIYGNKGRRWWRDIKD